jgi:hypothetical protein
MLIPTKHSGYQVAVRLYPGGFSGGGSIQQTSNPFSYAEGGVTGYAGDDGSLVQLNPFAIKQLMNDATMSGTGVNANTDLQEAGRLSGGVNLNRIDKGMDSRQMQSLMANYMNNIGDVGVNANVSRPLERGLPADYYQTNLMGSIPVGEGRLTAGVHGTHAEGANHTNARSLGYNTPFHGGNLNAHVNKPVEGKSSFGVQYNRSFADGGVVPPMHNPFSYADGGDVDSSGVAHFVSGGLDEATVAQYQAAVVGMPVQQIASEAAKLGLNAAQVGQVLGLSADAVTAAGYTGNGQINTAIANNIYQSPGVFKQVATPAPTAPAPVISTDPNYYANQVAALFARTGQLSPLDPNWVAPTPTPTPTPTAPAVPYTYGSGPTAVPTPIPTPVVPPVIPPVIPTVPKVVVPTTAPVNTTAGRDVLANTAGFGYGSSVAGDAYNQLLSQGFTDKQIRDSATQTYGTPVGSDPNWNTIVQSAGMNSPSGRPLPGSAQFYQPVYEAKYNNYANPLTAGNVAAYGTDPGPSSGFLKAAASGSPGINAFYQSLKDYAAQQGSQPFGMDYTTFNPGIKTMGANQNDLLNAYSYNPIQSNANVIPALESPFNPYTNDYTPVTANQVARSGSTGAKSATASTATASKAKGGIASLLKKRK